MDTPQSWLIRPREALYDLDNIQLDKLAAADRVQGLKAVFDLDHLVVEGHARESANNAAPRGVQMQLVTGDGTPIADTLVMANLGYLQFRTRPGVYRLEIRPGRGREIFGMESVGNEGWNSPTVEEAGDRVTVTSFEGVTLYPRLSRRPGMENVDVLQVEGGRDEDAGLVGNLMNKYVVSCHGGCCAVLMASVGCHRSLARRRRRRGWCRSMMAKRRSISSLSPRAICTR